MQRSMRIDLSTLANTDIPPPLPSPAPEHFPLPMPPRRRRSMVPPTTPTKSSSNSSRRTLSPPRSAPAMRTTFLVTNNSSPRSGGAGVHAVHKPSIRTASARSSIEQVRPGVEFAIEEKSSGSSSSFPLTSHHGGAVPPVPSLPPFALQLRATAQRQYRKRVESTDSSSSSADEPAKPSEIRLVTPSLATTHTVVPPPSPPRNNLKNVLDRRSRAIAACAPALRKFISLPTVRGAAST